MEPYRSVAGPGGNILGQLGLAADNHRGVIVGAAEQIEPLALMLCRKLVQNAQHRVLVVHIGHGGKVDDLGILGRSHRVAAIGVALDAVSLMERRQSCSSSGLHQGIQG